MLYISKQTHGRSTVVADLSVTTSGPQDMNFRAICLGKNFILVFLSFRIQPIRQVDMDGLTADPKATQIEMLISISRTQIYRYKIEYNVK